ncbi:MAG: glycosyltransferase family 4 protein [Akkermansiaceae bacterium]|nr:glycosyltransferase family 4 protein [Akkermansiaceae bacterium]
MSRILHVPRRFATHEWGGTESVIYNLCREQQQQGHQPEIHTSRALAPEAREIWRDIPIRRYRYCYPFFGLTPQDILALDKKGGNLLSLDLFHHLLTAKDVRIYHAHVLKRMGGAVMTAARLRRKPFVATLHGNVFDVPPAEAASVVEAQQGHFEWGKPFGALFRSRHLLDEADAVLCVGFSEYEKAKASLGHDRVYHLPNGVTPHSFANGNRATGRAHLGWPEDAIGFGCLSRIDPQKNQLLLVEAFASLVAKEPASDFRLLLGGPVTTPDYLEEIVQLIARHNLQQKVTLHPAVVAESALHRDLLTSLDCFVLPSRHEPFGIVVLEAWASGTPVIASHVGGLMKLISHEEDGLHFPSGDAESLTHAMTRIAKEPELRHALASRGKEKMTSQYTWKAVNARLEEIYQLAENRHR